jgi:Replication-relaxation
MSFLGPFGGSVRELVEGPLRTGPDHRLQSARTRRTSGAAFGSRPKVRKVVTERERRAARLGAASIAALGSRLTERDRQVALDCYEHRVLTTEQLRRLHFRSARRTRRRLELLYQLRVLDRFRPPKPRGEGSSPYHWILDEAGAHIAAEALGLERSDLRWRRQAAIALARSSILTHQLEVNEFFTRLATDAREVGGRLAAWWGERRCRAALDGAAAPDGYGVLELPGRAPLGFLLELDRGTEDHERLRQKLRRYAKALPRSPLAEQAPLVLIAVPTPARGDRLAHTLAPSTVRHTVVAWTPAHSPLATLRDEVAAASWNAATGGRKW